MVKENKSAKQPLKTIRAGQIKASIWENTRKVGKDTYKVMSATIVKSYMDKETDEWKETTSFNVNDLPKLELVAREAYQAIVTKEVSSDSDDEEQDE